MHLPRVWFAPGVEGKVCVKPTWRAHGPAQPGSRRCGRLTGRQPLAGRPPGREVAPVRRSDGAESPLTRARPAPGDRSAEGAAGAAACAGGEAAGEEGPRVARSPAARRAGEDCGSLLRREMTEEECACWCSALTEASPLNARTRAGDPAGRQCPGLPRRGRPRDVAASAPRVWGAPAEQAGRTARARSARRQPPCCRRRRPPQEDWPALAPPSSPAAACLLCNAGSRGHFLVLPGRHYAAAPPPYHA